MMVWRKAASWVAWSAVKTAGLSVDEMVAMKVVS